MLTLDARPAIPNIKFSCAISCELAWKDSRFERYCSYVFRTVGRWTTGYNGAHSWKKMLMSWSERRRGGTLAAWLGLAGEIVEGVSVNARVGTLDEKPPSASLLLKTSDTIRQTSPPLHERTYQQNIEYSKDQQAESPPPSTKGAEP